MEHKVVTDYTNVNVENDSVKVYVRARPPQEGYEVPPDMFALPGERPSKKVTIRDVTNRSYGEHAFLFDRVFWTDERQEEVYEEVAVKLINHCLDGYNSCCFAYGQTGSGKTYSMFGESGDLRGIIPRSVEEIFSALEDRSRTKEVAVLVSFLEMYCDAIRDLGNAYLDKARPDSASRQKTSDWFHQSKVTAGSFEKGRGDYLKQNLEIHEDVDGNVFVKDLSVIPVTTPEEVVTIMQMGFRLRATHETKMNSVSSRSHTVFTITIIQKDKKTGETVTGMLNLVDLAGSERLRKSESEGVRLREALSINSSLSALGKVIMALDPSLPSSFVPYRDSKLTRLLQNSLGGNSYTSLLATIHPRQYDYEECLSTLQFANRCRNVRNQPRVNYVDNAPGDKEKRIRKLMQEVSDLKRALYNLQTTSALRMQRMMQELGIEGEVLPDGRFRTADGKIIGMSADGAMGMLDGAGGDGMLDFGGFGAGAGGPGARGRLGGNKELLAKLEAEHRVQRALKDKLHARKEELVDAKTRGKREALELRTLLVQQRRVLEGSKAHVEERATKLEGLLEESKGAHYSQVTSLVEHNAKLLQHHHEMLASVPESLRVNSDVLARAAKIEKIVRDEESAKREAELRALRASADKELASEKARFDAWRAQEKAAKAKLVEEVGAFHKRKTAQTDAFKREIKALFHYSHALSRTVRDLVEGRHPVRQLASGKRVFALPPKAVPVDPLRALQPSDFLQGLLERAGKRRLLSGSGAGEGGGDGGAEAGESTPRSALDAIRKTRASKGGWIEGDGGVSVAEDDGGGGGASRPPQSSSGPRSASNPRHHHNQHRGGGGGGGSGTTAPVPLPVGGSAEETPEDGGDGDGGGGGGGSGDLDRTDSTAAEGVARTVKLVLGDLDLDSRIERMDTKALRAHATDLRRFIREDLRKKVEEQVLNDLSEHPTVEYIRQLEGQKAQYQAMWREEQQKHKELRVAYNAQARSLSRTNVEVERLSRRRPGTSLGITRPGTAGGSVSRGSGGFGGGAGAGGGSARVPSRGAHVRPSTAQGMY